MKGLKDKHVLVTGGAGGIGAATARRFLDEGSQVIILDRDEAACRLARQEMPALSATIVADVSSNGSVTLAFNEMDKLFDSLDVVINNAGISHRNPFLEITPEQWSDVIAVNLNGVFYVAQEAARRMSSKSGGVILNMGSTNGLTGYHYYADYNASKAGVIELTRSMALELGPSIRVNAVCPGFIMTPMQEAEYTDDMLMTFKKKIPLNKLGKPSDVAAMFAFLASDEASFISGQTFVIDGGEISGGLASQA